MMRFIAKWYISRSIDCDLDLPAWVVDRIGKDRRLNDYYQQSIRLAKLLSNEPAIGQAAQVDPSVIRSHESNAGTDLSRPAWYSGTSRTAMMCAGLAAMIVLAYSSWSLMSNGSRDGGSDSPKAELLVKDEPLPKELPPKLKSKAQQLAQASRSIMEKLQNNSKEIADSLVQAEELVALFKSDDESTGATYVSTFVDSTGSLGARYGQVLNSLGEHCQSENEQLISHGADAVRYFVHDLPIHATKLAGL